MVTNRSGAVAIAPTTYNTADECGAVANALTWSSSVEGTCLPARMTDAFVASYTAKQANEAAAYFGKAAQLERDRPALEAEKRQIEALPIEKRTKAQMDRLIEIERRFDALNQAGVRGIDEKSIPQPTPTLGACADVSGRSSARGSTGWMRPSSARRAA